MITESKIIKLFLGDKKPKTIREISQKIKADYKITHVASQRLIAQQILNAETVGKSSLCTLNEDYYGFEIYNAENERKEQIFKNKNILQLYKEIMGKTETGFFVLLLFGSYAKSKQTESSDIDLLFISNEKNFENKITDLLSLLPLKTHYLVFTEEEFVRMKNSKKLTVIQEAIESNIILYGTETYYKIKNA